MKKEIKEELVNSLKKIFEVNEKDPNSLTVAGDPNSFTEEQVLDIEKKLNILKNTDAELYYGILDVIAEKDKEFTYSFFQLLQTGILNNKDIKNSLIYEFCLNIDEKLTNQITKPLDSLIEHSINNESEEKTMTLIVCFKCIDLENENKKLTLTDEQYKTWLETDITHINTEQFETLYGISQRKQKDLRSHLKDPLPSFQLHGKGKHCYNKMEVEKWLENYKRINPFNK